MFCAVDPNLARVGQHQPDEMFQQDAFPAAAAADDDERFALRDIEIDSAQNFLRADASWSSQRTAIIGEEFASLLVES